MILGSQLTHARKRHIKRLDSNSKQRCSPSYQPKRNKPSSSPPITRIPAIITRPKTPKIQVYQVPTPLAISQTGSRHKQHLLQAISQISLRFRILITRRCLLIIIQEIITNLWVIRFHKLHLYTSSKDSIQVFSFRNTSNGFIN